jgi:hypothetical protein
MSDSSSEKSNPAETSGPIPPQPDLHAADEGGDIYDVVDLASAPPEPAAGGQQPSGEWYMAREGGKPQGPFDLAEMKRRILCGELAARDLVWKEGMPAWVAARDVPELFAVPGAPRTPPPLRAAAPQPQPAEIVRAVNALFSNPFVYRVVGYVGAALAVVTFLVSLTLWYWGRTWFTGALIFALLFFIGQAAGAVLEAIQRLEADPSSRPESTKQAK